MARSRLTLSILLITPHIVSCNLLTPIVFVSGHTKTVTPEFDKLPGTSVAVLVWTDPSTLFDYPYARIELATFVADKLSAEMNRRKLKTRVISPRDVEDFIQKNVRAQVDPRAVGRAVGADHVIFLEVIRFGMRDRDHPQFLRGRIDATVVVHDIRAEPDELRSYPLTPVTCVYPDGGPVALTAVNSPLIREGAYRRFAEIVARKFYEHTLKLKL